jgi:uroporphyrinogen decarboxylase
MNHVERFYATIERRSVDRPCTWLGLVDPAACQGLLEHFGVGSVSELIIKLDDDIVALKLPCHSLAADSGYLIFDFTKETKIDRQQQTLNMPSFFEDVTDPRGVEDFEWPDPSDYIDPDECGRAVKQLPYGRAVLAIVWSSYFQDMCAAFGMENTLIRMQTAPQLVQAVAERILDLYLKANEIFYLATKGKLDAVMLGNDFAGRTGLLLSRQMIKKFALPGIAKLVAQAKRYGLKVIYHSCGSIREIIPDLIDIGVDVIHPIEPLATGMEPAELKRGFGNKVSFCGGVDAQELLVNGTPEQVREKVLELKKIFPTGLIISPSNEAILPDVPPANVEAMFHAVRHSV